MTTVTTDPHTCPTLCDTDCEVNGWGCHDPAGCEGRQLADKLRALIDAGFKIQFGKHPVAHQGRDALEPYYVLDVSDPMYSRIWHGVSPGDAVARARQSVIPEVGEDGDHAQ
jgi:hypothetical protein